MTTARMRPETEALLTPSEVATLFRVDPKTVTRWAKAGKLTSIRTLGGHRRYCSTATPPRSTPEPGARCTTSAVFDAAPESLLL
jgi:excisionase family DNA binding protein